MSCFLCSHEFDHNIAATANFFIKTELAESARFVNLRFCVRYLQLIRKISFRCSKLCLIPRRSDVPDWHQVCQILSQNTA